MIWQISSSFRMSLGAVRSSHSNRDTSRFVLSISFPPVSVSSAREPLPAHRPLPGPPVPQSPPLKPPPSASFPTHGNLRPAHSIAALRKAHLFRTDHRSNHCPPPASPHTEISASPQHRSPSQGPPVPHRPLLKPLPSTSFPTHGNLRQPTAPQLFAQPAFFHTRLPPLWKITRRCPRSSGWGGSPSSLSTHSPPVRSGSADRTGTPPIPFWAPPAPGRCSGRSCRCSASRRRCGD